MNAQNTFTLSPDDVITMERCALLRVNDLRKEIRSLKRRKVEGRLLPATQKAIKKCQDELNRIEAAYSTFLEQTRYAPEPVDPLDVLLEHIESAYKIRGGDKESGEAFRMLGNMGYVFKLLELGIIEYSSFEGDELTCRQIAQELMRIAKNHTLLTVRGEHMLTRFAMTDGDKKVVIKTTMEITERDTDETEI